MINIPILNNERACQSLAICHSQLVVIILTGWPRPRSIIIPAGALQVLSPSEPWEIILSQTIVSQLYYKYPPHGMWWHSPTAINVILDWISLDWQASGISFSQCFFSNERMHTQQFYEKKRLDIRQYNSEIPLIKLTSCAKFPFKTPSLETNQ